MPLFMDRHEITTSLTLEEIATMHDLDVQISPQFGVRWITYYLDPVLILSPTSRVFVRSGFCIGEAPNREMMVACHRASHGLIPNEVQEVDREAVEQYLGRMHLPGAAEPWDEPALRTILVSELVSAQGAAARHHDSAQGRLVEYERLIQESIAGKGGLPIKRPGHRIMASFVSASMAVECAVAIRESVSQLNTGHPEESLHVRIGVSAGHPLKEGEDIFGAVTRAAEAICASAPPGTILLSGVVRELCAGGRFSFTERGLEALQGFTERVPLYRVDSFSAPSKRESRGHGLSDREVEVIRLIAAGKSNQQIADALVISHSTVARHVSNIFDKTAAKNRTEAAAFAYHNSLA